MLYMPAANTASLTLPPHTSRMLPLPPPPTPAPQPMGRLVSLGLPQNMYFRMNRWHVTDILEQLQACELDTGNVQVV